MTVITIELPEDLAHRLEPVQNRLVEIIELGLREIEPAKNALHGDVVDFLATAPSLDDILSYHPPDNVALRVNDLLERNETGRLSETEEEELDQYEELDYLITMVKARARLNIHHS